MKSTNRRVMWHGVPPLGLARDRCHQSTSPKTCATPNHSSIILKNANDAALASLPRRPRKRSGGVTLTIAIAIPFGSGVLLCAEASRIPSARIRLGSSRIFQKRYESNPSYARSIFVISDPVNFGIVVVQQCERALDLLQPAEYTIDGMRATIENSLLETYQEQLDSELDSNPTASLLIALYSSADQRYALFRTNGIGLREHVGYDCQGSAAYVGHFLLRDRYEAAESMGALAAC